MRRFHSPRGQLIEATGLLFKKSKTDSERWNLPYGLVDLRNVATKYEDAVVIRSIWITSHKRGRGYGAQVLDALCDAADVLGIRLGLDAHAYGRTPKLSTEDLVAWYERYGFRRRSRHPSRVSERVPMVRAPRLARRRAA